MLAYILIALLFLQGGICTYYAPNLMERVAAYRVSLGQAQPCAECVGYVAVLDCDRLGEHVWLQGPQGIEGPFLAVDCAQAVHRANLERRGLVAEVDWPTAQRWRMAGPVTCNEVDAVIGRLHAAPLLACAVRQEE